MSRVVVVTIRRPLLSQKAVEAIHRTVSLRYPDATVVKPRRTPIVHITADDDPELSRADRRAIARDRSLRGRP